MRRRPKALQSHASASENPAQDHPTTAASPSGTYLPVASRAPDASAAAVLVRFRPPLHGFLDQARARHRAFGLRCLPCQACVPLPSELNDFGGLVESNLRMSLPNPALTIQYAKCRCFPFEKSWLK